MIVYSDFASCMGVQDVQDATKIKCHAVLIFGPLFQNLIATSIKSVAPHMRDPNMQRTQYSEPLTIAIDILSKLRAS